MKQIEIRNRYTNEIIVSGKYESIKDCLEKNRDADLRDADLMGADLRDAYLRGADLRGADLWGADLRGADLRGADLRGADLRDADLRGADLWGANLRDANLRDANLRGVNLRGVNLRGAKKYYMSHDFCMEIVRRQKLEIFTSDEWQIIGQLAIHKFCWEDIQKRYGKKIISFFKKIADIGFSEYLNYYEGVKEE